MPPIVRITKEKIIDAALCLVRENGEQAFSARDVAQKLGCSTQPVFSNYASMALLRADVIKAAETIYNKYIADSLTEPVPYLASGMAYVRFASEEPRLFALLFMRDRKHEAIGDWDDVRDVISVLVDKTGLTVEEAYKFHMMMWVFVHGIATMLATGYLSWDEEQVRRMLSLQFRGNCAAFGVKRVLKEEMQ